jgi:hypothetical protein
MTKLLTLALIFFISCSLSKFEIIDTGYPIFDEKIFIKDSVRILYSDYKFRNTKVIIYNNIKYYVCINGNNEINEILTKDTNFFTPEGYRIFNRFSTIKDDTISTRRYYEFYICTLKSGWKAIFQYEDEFLHDTVQISWFEK